jgi:hypothetical protein
VDRDVTVIGHYAAGGNIYQHIEITPESARMIAEAILHLQKKPEKFASVLKKSEQNAHGYFCLVACNDQAPTIQEGA